MPTPKISPRPCITAAHLEETLRVLALEEHLEEVLGALLKEEGEEVPERFTASVHSFQEAGVLTYNNGVVLTLSTGTEFQLTIVRSAR